MVSYRPIGVTILAAFIIITYSIIFIVGVAVLFWGVSNIPELVISGGVGIIMGIIILIWAFLRLSMGFGLLRMRRRAWKSAMVVFIIGLGIDLFFATGQVLLDVIIIVYLLIVKRHFRYGD